jgi:hypothetical protein
VTNKVFAQRTAAFNPMNGTNTTILIFNSSLLFKFNNNFTTSTNFTTNSTQNISDAFYITNSVNSYFIMIGNTGSNYSLHYYTNATLINAVKTNISIGTVYVKCVQSNGNIFFLFQTGIYIYA